MNQIYHLSHLPSTTLHLETNRNDAPSHTVHLFIHRGKFLVYIEKCIINHGIDRLHYCFMSSDYLSLVMYWSCLVSQWLHYLKWSNNNLYKQWGISCPNNLSHSSSSSLWHFHLSSTKAQKVVKINFFRVIVCFLCV